MENLNQEVVEMENAVEVEKVEYKLDNGDTCSRSAYIRQEFNKDRSRKDIAAELGVKYYTVYTATANMFNAVHTEEGGNTIGRGAVMVAKVNNKFEMLNEYGSIVENEEEAVKVPRAEMMRELFEAGKSRGEIKDHFGVPYATVYAATKGAEGEAVGRGRSKKTIVHPTTGEVVNRVDYIKELFDGGMDRREIATQLTIMTNDLVDYAVVWAATKPAKEESVEAEPTAQSEDESIYSEEQ